MAVFGDDQTAYVDTIRFEKAVHSVFFSKLRHAIVSDQGVGSNQNLTAVRGIGKAFGIAGHRRIENDLTGNGIFCPE